LQENKVKFLTIGNALTASRLLLLPIIIVAIVLGKGPIAVAGMALVVITDLLDGRISRRLGQASTFGGTLDSTVDFVLIYSLFITFYAAGRLLVWEFVVIYIAMLSTFLMQIGSMASGSSEGTVKSKSGKLTGALQYFFLLFLVASEVLPKTEPVRIVHWVIFGVLAASIVLSSVRALGKLGKIV
jgi:cardiolipin synthase